MNQIQVCKNIHLPRIEAPHFIAESNHVKSCAQFVSTQSDADQSMTQHDSEFLKLIGRNWLRGSCSDDWS
jgi:hypothetical protein